MRKEDDTAKVHLSEVSSVILQTNQVYISAYLLMELAKAKISLVVSDESCNPIGQYLPLYGAHNTVKRIGEQLQWGEPIKKRVWQRIVKDKINSQARFLEEREYTEAPALRTIALRCVPEIRQTGRRMQHAFISRRCLAKASQGNRPALKMRP